MDTKKLKQKILDLAIHGKLVPQDPNDEPASVLLERIKAEKEQLIKEGKVKRNKKSSSSTSHYEKVPFEVPRSWVWCRLGDVCNYGECTTVSISCIANDAWVLELEDIEKDSAKLLQLLTKQERNIKGVRHAFKAGDVLYSKLRTYLNKVFVAKQSGYCSTEIVPISYHQGISNQYVCHVMRSPYFLEYTAICGFGVKMPRLSTSDACNALIPLPPLSEQHRIVAEIERWFKVIDELERNQADLQAAIKQTKAKVLDLAIHGKLVPQNPNDEPASELLRRINPKAVATSDTRHYQKVPFEVPKSWMWCKLGDLCNYGNCINIDVSAISDNAWILELEDIEKDTAKILRILPKKERNINGIRHKFMEGDVLYSKLRTYLNKVFVAEQNGYCSTEIVPISYYQGVSNQYMCHVMRSPYFLAYTQMHGYGVKMPRLSTTDARKALVPLPPFAEQKRIVDKITQIFAQLDDIVAEL